MGSGFEPHWRPQPAKLPSFGGYSLENLTLPYLTSQKATKLAVNFTGLKPQANTCAIENACFMYALTRSQMSCTLCPSSLAFMESLC